MKKFSIFNSQFSIIIAAFIAVMFFSCGTSKAPQGDKKASVANIPALSKNDSQRLKYFYFEAMRQMEAGNHDAAFSLLEHCLAINPYAAEVHYSMATYYSTLGEDSIALQEMKRAAELNPDNNTYLENLAVAHLNTKNFDEAIKAYENLYSNNKERSDLLNILMQIYSRKRDYDSVIRTIDRIETIEGKSEETALAKMQVYSLQGKKTEELNELKQLSQKYPSDMNYRVMMGNWLLQNEREEDALKEYEYVLEQEPDNIMAKMSLLDYYRANDKDSIADALQYEILISSATPTESKIAMIRRFVADNEQQGGDSTAVLNLFNRILEKPQKETEMYEMYAAYMSLKNMPNEAIIEVLEKALEIEPDNAGIRLSLIQKLWAMDDYDGVVAMCKPALEYNPDEMVFYYFLGMAYFQKDEDDKTLETFNMGVSQINDRSNKDIVSDLYAIMGDLLHKKGKKEEAYEAYENGLKWRSDNWGVLNNYAYYLSLEGENLQKAEQMSYRTVKAEPTNATYLDTYAWILFMQERYEEALVYIEQTLQNDSVPSGIVLEHAGDIYAKNNDMEHAAEYWQKAVDNGNDSKTLLKKLKLKKYIGDGNKEKQ